MKNLNDSEWILINEIIYKINTINSISHVQKTFLDLIKHLIPYDSALFYLKDPAGKDFFINPVCVNYDSETADRYIQIGSDKDYTLGIMQCSKCMVCKETDLLSDGEREGTEYYKLFLEPQGLHYGIQVTFVYDNALLGIVSLLRKRDKPDFYEKDVFVLDMLKDHLAYRLHNELPKIAAVTHKNDIDLKLFEEKYDLTKRELDVLKLIIKDYSNDEIGAILVLSRNTVKKHILNIYKKFNVNSRLQLFRLINLHDKDD